MKKNKSLFKNKSFLLELMTLECIFHSSHHLGWKQTYENLKDFGLGSVCVYYQKARESLIKG